MAPQHFDGEHPYSRPPGSDLSMFIQWMNTDLCADFVCDCGHGGHIDSDFAHFVRCPACGATYEMGTQVIARRLDDPEDATPGLVKTFGDEPEATAYEVHQYNPDGTVTVRPAGPPMSPEEFQPRRLEPLRVTILHEASPGERFDPSAFAGNIGSTIPVHTPTGSVDGVVISAQVRHDGRAVELTLDVPPGTGE